MIRTANSILQRQWSQNITRLIHEIMREHSLHVQSGAGGLGLLIVPGGVTCDIIQKSPLYVDSLVAFVAEQVVPVVALTAR